MVNRDEAAGHDGQGPNDVEAEARREFLKSVAKTAAKGATVAPAVAMLLAAVSRPKSARAQSYGGCGGGSIL